MKKLSTSLIIRETKIKATTRYLYISTRMAKMEKTDPPKCGLECGKVTLTHCQWQCKQFDHFGKFGSSFKTLGMAHDPDIPLLGVYQRKTKVSVYT